MFGSILFNIVLNDLLAVSKKSQLYDFANDSTISDEANSTDHLLKILKKNQNQLRFSMVVELVQNSVSFTICVQSYSYSVIFFVFSFLCYFYSVSSYYIQSTYMHLVSEWELDS